MTLVGALCVILVFSTTEPTLKRGGQGVVLVTCEFRSVRGTYRLVSGMLQSRDCHVLILGRQDARTGFKELGSVSQTRNALKIEANCTRVAPPPTTSTEGGTDVKLQARRVLVSSK